MELKKGGYAWHGETFISERFQQAGKALAEPALTGAFLKAMKIYDTITLLKGTWFQSVCLHSGNCFVCFV